MLRLRPVSRSHREVRTCTWTLHRPARGAGPPSTRSGPAPVPPRPVFSNSSRTAPICASLGRSSESPRDHDRPCACARTPAGRRRRQRGRGSPAGSRSPGRTRPGRVAFADEIVGGRPGRAGAVTEAPNVHRGPRRQAGPRRAATARPTLNRSINLGPPRPGGGVGVRPARELVEVVADARDLAAALPLDSERPAAVQVCVRAIACRSSVGGRHTRPPPPWLFPGGALGPRHARRATHDGAPLSHERTGPGVRGTASPVRRAAPGSDAVLRGVRRGAQHPLARAQCFTLGRLA